MKTNRKLNGNLNGSMMVNGSINISINGTYTESHEFIRRDGSIGRETDTRTADNLNLNIGLDNVKVEAGLEGILGLIKDSTGFDTIPEKKIVDNTSNEEDNTSNYQKYVKPIITRIADEAEKLLNPCDEGGKFTDDVLPEIGRLIMAFDDDQVLSPDLKLRLYDMLNIAHHMNSVHKLSSQIGRYLIRELLMIALENY